MKIFNEKSFNKLSQSRKLNILYKLAQKAEKSAQDLSLQQLKLYHQFLETNKEPLLSKLNKEFNKVISVSDRTFLNYLMYLERFLCMSISDYQASINRADKITNKRTLPIEIVLDCVRSAHNVGAFFRNADCFGVRHIHLLGFTPTPNHPSVIKTAMSTEKLTSWTHWESYEDYLESLDDQTKLVSIETSKNAQSLSTAPAVSGALHIVFGNEQFGVHPTILKASDELYQVDLLGSKNSLNVSVCGGLVLHHFSTRHEALMNNS